MVTIKTYINCELPDFEPTLFTLLDSNADSEDAAEMKYTMWLLTTKLDKQFQDSRPVFPSIKQLQEAKEMLKESAGHQSHFALTLPDPTIFALYRIAKLTHSTPQELIVAITDMLMFSNNLASTRTILPLYKQIYQINLKKRNIPLVVLTIAEKINDQIAKFISKTETFSVKERIKEFINKQPFFEYVRNKFILGKQQPVNETYEAYINQTSATTNEKDKN